MILRPEKPISPLVACVQATPPDAAHQGVITATFPEKHARFRELLRGKGLHWERSAQHWRRLIDERWSGATTDRAVELAHALLLAGFIVEVSDDLAARVVAGDYAPEHTRWLRCHLPSGRLALVWGRRDDLYHQAMRIPGARYDAPRVTAPPEAWAELRDFAAAHGFRLSPAAEDALRVAEARYQESVLVVPAPARRAPQQPAQAVAAGGIDPDLLDTED